MKAKIIANKNYSIGKIDKRIYGSFIEHLGRAVYEGIYEPDHPSADGNGFRRDVIDLIKEIDVPIVRYPGGNFVSGYNWEDGTGPKSQRPQKIEAAWGTVETNQFGTDEFCNWAPLANSEVMMAVNLGTRGPEAAKNLLEYCNMNTDTYYANLRKKNGFKNPFNIKTWCLGNEMDGSWQIGHKTADEYARVATETANLMKMIDPDIELVACGSSSYDRDTFGEWELTVLDHAYEVIDYLSLHQYYDNPDDNYEEFVGKSVHMDKFIKGVVAICDAIKTKKHSRKTVSLSFDEWNVWHSQKTQYDKWQIAPHQLEDVYNLEDALLVGCMLMTLQNNCDRVKIACLAQLVNVIAPIMTEKGGKSWRQTVFYPYMYASKYGRGTAMNAVVKCDTYEAEFSGTVPYLETSVIHNEEKRQITVFAVNRAKNEDMELDINFENFGKCELCEHIELYSDDIKATNTKDEQNVVPNSVKTGEKIILKKHSWNMLIYKY